MKIFNYDVVFREIPDEISLALQISNCKLRCHGCHSQFLWEDVGDELTEEFLQNLMNKYKGMVSTILFMGGEFSQKELIPFVEQAKREGFKTAWYAGLPEVDNDELLSKLDYYKIGPWDERYGPLNKKTTNQRLYKNENGNITDITYKFWDKE